MWGFADLPNEVAVKLTCFTVCPINPGKLYTYDILYDMLWAN